MTALTRRQALRSICTTAAASAAVAVPVSVAAVAAASEATAPTVPPGYVQPPLARRSMIEGYVIDRDPAKLVVGATVMFMRGNGELTIGTIAEWLDDAVERNEKRRWRVHVDYPEGTRKSGYRCVISADAIGVVESGPEPRAGWDSAWRVFDLRLT